MKINNGHRRRQKELRLSALSNGAKYGKKLYRARLNETLRVVDLFVNIPENKIIEQAPLLLDETYVNKIIPDLYFGVGVPIAKQEVNNFLSIKSDQDIWTNSIQNWIAKNAGDKIVLIKDGWKEAFQNLLKDSLSSYESSVEDLTTYLTRVAKQQLPDLLEWQVRRIVQTEALTALSVAQNESIKALNVPFQKTWGIAGNNTRPAHIAMEGVTIDSTDLFNVDGELMEYPRDPSNGASARNIINCSCFVLNTPKRF